MFEPKQAAIRATALCAWTLAARGKDRETVDRETRAFAEQHKLVYADNFSPADAIMASEDADALANHIAKRCGYLGA